MEDADFTHAHWGELSRLLNSSHEAAEADPEEGKGGDAGLHVAAETSPPAGHEAPQPPAALPVEEEVLMTEEEVLMTEAAFLGPADEKVATEDLKVDENGPTEDFEPVAAVVFVESQVFSNLFSNLWLIFGKP